MSAVEAGLRYRDVLRLPHAGRLFAAALLGRLSFATVSLALLLAVQRSTGSFAAAGAATGAFGLANVLVAAARARLVDRLGQPVALPRLAVAYAVLLCVLAELTTSAGVPAWLLVAVSALAGLCPPPLGAAMRALWARLTEGTGSLPHVAPPARRSGRRRVHVRVATPPRHEWERPSRSTVTTPPGAGAPLRRADEAVADSRARRPRSRPNPASCPPTTRYPEDSRSRTCAPPPRSLPPAPVLGVEIGEYEATWSDGGAPASPPALIDALEPLLRPTERTDVPAPG